MTTAALSLLLGVFAVTTLAGSEADVHHDAVHRAHEDLDRAMHQVEEHRHRMHEIEAHLREAEHMLAAAEQKKMLLRGADAADEFYAEMREAEVEIEQYRAAMARYEHEAEAGRDQETQLDETVVQLRDRIANLQHAAHAAEHDQHTDL